MDVACGRWPHKKLGLRCGRTRRPAGYGWHGVYFCSVGRAFTPAVPGCLTRPLFGCVGVWSMRRGGIDAARRNTADVGRLRFAGCVFCLVGRAFTPAEPIKFLKFFNVRRERAVFPGTPRGEHPCREAYMPPLQTPGTAYTNPKNVAMRRTPTGRMHAAPTNRPGTAGKWVRQTFAADPPACERGRGFRTGARMSRTGSKETVL